MKFKALSVLIILFFIVLFLSRAPTRNEAWGTENKTLILKFRRNGEILNKHKFENETQGVLFFTDSKWGHVKGKFLSVRKNGRDLPRVVVPKNKEVTLNFLWPVPSFGKTVLRLDLSGFEENETIDVNEELALQKYRTLEQEKLSSTGTVRNKVEPYLQRSKELLRKHRFLSSLNQSLWGLEALAMDRAESKISEVRWKNYSIKVVDGNGEPVENATVIYNLSDRDFQLGWFGPDINPDLRRKMKSLGFNTHMQFAFWHETEPENDRWNFGESGSKISKTSDFDQGISGLIGDTPRYLSDLSYEELHKEVEEHVEKAIKELEEEKNVKVWECYGLGMRYMADQSLQMTVNRSKQVNIRSTRICIQTVKEKTDGPTVVTGWNIDGSEIRNETYDDVPYRYYQRLNGLNFSIGFDFMYFGGAHELYPGLVEKGVYRKEAIGSARKNWIPMHHLYSVSKMLDWYSGLDRSVYIQYFQAPSNYLEGQQGYWHQPWNEEVQAQWIKKYYTLVYSKPYIKGINYLEVKDSGWKDFKTGIFYRNGTPKRAYYALKDLIGTWTSSGKIKTNSDGQVSFSGFTGNYKVKLHREGYKEKTVRLSESRKLVTLERI